MYATVRLLKCKQSFKDENERLVREQLVPDIKAIPGFIDYYLIYGEKDTEYSIGIFKDKKGAEAMNKLAGDFVKKHAADVEITTITEGEVVVHPRALAHA